MQKEKALKMTDEFFSHYRVVNACIDAIDRVAMTAGQMDIKPDTIHILAEMAEDNLTKISSLFEDCISIKA